MESRGREKLGRVEERKEKGGGREEREKRNKERTRKKELGWR